MSHQKIRRAQNKPASLVLPALLVALMILAMPAPADANKNVLRVGPGKPYATIQSAVDAATPGSKILVYPGNYPEIVIINKNNLQIIAKGKGVLVTPPDHPAGFEVNADHVTIKGFRINFGSGYHCSSGIRFIGSYNTFQDNYLNLTDGCEGINALVSRDPDGGSDYNVVERNTINGADIGIEVAAGTANIHDAINKGNVIRDNTLLAIYMTPIGVANGVDFLVSGNRAEGTGQGDCILVGTLIGNHVAQGHHTIVNNTMFDCAGNGIALYADPGTIVTHNRIAGNTIWNCLGSCIALSAASGATLTDNEVASNGVSGSVNSNGIRLAAENGAQVSGNLIQGNIAYDNHNSGISLTTGADYNRVLLNQVHNNAVGILVAGDNNLIADNFAYHNTQALIDDGKGNVWHDNCVDPARWSSVDTNLNGLGANCADVESSQAE